MVAFLILVLVVIPVVEIAAAIQVAIWIGVWPTVFLLIAVSVVGMWLVKREGIRTWRHFREQVEAREVPTDTVVDGMLLLVAGVMLTIPGFVTDVLGLLLLLPPVRKLVRILLIGRFTRAYAVGRRGAQAARVVKVSSTVVNDRSSRRDHPGRLDPGTADPGPGAGPTYRGPGTGPSGTGTPPTDAP
ncbi:MAG: FxsA family protein [Actinomycetia bacterium]|nr:FxsA family protein [Actinomycetes bacterium]